jgi:hypothetical protein
MTNSTVTADQMTTMLEGREFIVRAFVGIITEPVSEDHLAPFTPEEQDACEAEQEAISQADWEAQQEEERYWTPGHDFY